MKKYFGIIVLTTVFCFIPTVVAHAISLPQNRPGSITLSSPALDSTQSTLTATGSTTSGVYFNKCLRQGYTELSLEIMSVDWDITGSSSLSGSTNTDGTGESCNEYMNCNGFNTGGSCSPFSNNFSLNLDVSSLSNGTYTITVSDGESSTSQTFTISRAQTPTPSTGTVVVTSTDSATGAPVSSTWEIIGPTIPNTTTMVDLQGTGTSTTYTNQQAGPYSIPLQSIIAPSGYTINSIKIVPSERSVRQDPILAFIKNIFGPSALAVDVYPALVQTLLAGSTTEFDIKFDPLYPILIVGSMSAQNVAVLDKPSHLAWYAELFEKGMNLVRSIISPETYAQTAPSAGEPLKLSTPITNSGVETKASFTNAYFVDVGKNNGITSYPPVLKKGDPASDAWINSWDLNSVVPSTGVSAMADFTGIAANSTVDSGTTIRINAYSPTGSTGGLPTGTNLIAFCADIYGQVDPRPLSTRCTPLNVAMDVGPVVCPSGLTWDGSACTTVSQCPNNQAYVNGTCSPCGGTGCTGCGGSPTNPLCAPPITCNNGATNPPACSTNPAPTATLSADSSTVDQGYSTTLRWSSTGATRCTGTGFSTSGAASGNVSTGKLNTVGPQNYQVVCANAQGATSTPAFATVTVISPSVSISADPARVQSGGTSIISWKAVNVSSCQVKDSSGNTLASGAADFNGNFSKSSGYTATINSQSTFTIDCSTNSGTTAVKSVTVNIIPAFQEF